MPFPTRSDGPIALSRIAGPAPSGKPAAPVGEGPAFALYPPEERAPESEAQAAADAGAAGKPTPVAPARLVRPDAVAIPTPPPPPDVAPANPRAVLLAGQGAPAAETAPRPPAGAGDVPTGFGGAFPMLPIARARNHGRDGLSADTLGMVLSTGRPIGGPGQGAAIPGLASPVAPSAESSDSDLAATAVQVSVHAPLVPETRRNSLEIRVSAPASLQHPFPAPDETGPGDPSAATASAVGERVDVTGAHALAPEQVAAATGAVPVLAPGPSLLPQAADTFASVAPGMAPPTPMRAATGLAFPGSAGRAFTGFALPERDGLSGTGEPPAAPRNAPVPTNPAQATPATTPQPSALQTLPAHAVATPGTVPAANAAPADPANTGMRQAETAAAPLPPAPVAPPAAVASGLAAPLQSAAPPRPAGDASGGSQSRPRAGTGAPSDAATDRGGRQTWAPGERPFAVPAGPASLPQPPAAAPGQAADTASAPHMAPTAGESPAASGAAPVPPPDGGTRDASAGRARPPAPPVDTRTTATEPTPRGDDLPTFRELALPTAAPTTDAPRHASATSAVQPALPQAALQQAAVALTQAPDGQLELRLSPEELGRMQLTLAPSDTGILVSVQADRAETVDLIRRHADQLAQEFRDLGYRDVRFDFGRSGSSGQPPYSAPTERPADLATDDTGPPQAAASHPNIAPSAQLDIRL